jgi:DNA-binding transcriptional regulator YiaG
MTPADFKAARKALCLSQNDLAEVWGMGDNGGRTIRRWENGERPLNPIAAYALRLMLASAPDGIRQPGPSTQDGKQANTKEM